MRLSDVKENILVKVIKVNITDKRLLYMGLVKDTIVRVIKRSFFKGPMIINLRNYNLCISEKIANDVEVDFV